MSTARRRVTLADVAGQAGVSVPTVSKVLRGGTDVSDVLRERVMAVVTQLGYRRPGTATAVGRAATGSLVDLVLSGVEGTWASRVLSGVERAAVAAGVDLVVSVAREGDETWLQRVLARNLGGAVLGLVDVSAAQLSTFRAARFQIVLLDPVRQPAEDVASVGATNWAGGRTVAEHLAGLGHREVAVIGGRRSHMYSQARIDGFRSGLDKAGIILPSERVVYGDWKRDEATFAALELLRRPVPPTAIFACSDNMALGVYEALTSQGLRVPDDVSVVGFDDLPEANWAHPALTTMHQPIAEMGEAALRLLVRMRADPAHAVSREELATALVVRKSTAAPAVRVGLG